MACILIVDDDAIHGQMLVEGLLEAGWEAHAAGGMQEAMSLVRDGRHSLVVSDLRLDDGDGTALLRALRADGSSVPVILMSSFGAEGTPQEARDAGAFAYLAKPFGLSELLEFVERAHDGALQRETPTSPLPDA